MRTLSQINSKATPVMAALSCTATMEAQPQHDGVTLRATAEAHIDVQAPDAVVSAAPSSRPDLCVATPGDVEKKKEAQRQAWFENVAKKKLKIPNSYVQVAPLIIRWASDLDDYYDGHTDEVSVLLSAPIPTTAPVALCVQLLIGSRSKNSSASLAASVFHKARKYTLALRKLNIPSMLPSRTISRPMMGPISF
jgi:hypothetical protein